MTAREMFGRMSMIGELPTFAGDGICEFDVAGAGRWTVAVRGGKVAVSEGSSGAPDLEVSCTESDLREIVGGRRVVVLIMQGRVQVQGRLELLLQLRALFHAAFPQGAEPRLEEEAAP